jgi:hypothetical protein
MSRSSVVSPADISRTNTFMTVPPSNYAPSVDDSNLSTDSDSEVRGPAHSVNGIEPVVIRTRDGVQNVLTSSLIPRPDNSTSRNYRKQNQLETKHRVWENMANKALPPENVELMIKMLEKRADEKVLRTYMAGQALPDHFEDAVVLRVGLTFMPGADKQQVNRQEQTDMTGREPDQKDALWRVNTAGHLLSDFDVLSDLSVVQRDRTADIARKALERVTKKRNNEYPTSPKSSSSRSLSFRAREYDAVTIDSSEVFIVNDLKDRTEEWDIESTLIEVDGSSVMDLIVNYRTLISRGGPDMSFDETKMLLDTMIEDARRLCARSPILFRMATRQKIINSKNTRYGVDQGRFFQTLTTSKGIKEIISLSASYYNSLDPAGTNDEVRSYLLKTLPIYPG